MQGRKCTTIPCIFRWSRMERTAGSTGLVTIDVLKCKVSNNITKVDKETNHGIVI
jgi:hypothetical protein